MALCLMSFTSVSAQAIYNEVNKIMQQAEKVKNDTTKDMQLRLIATFKSDAIYYMILQSSKDSTFTEYTLGQQTFAMTEFVNSFVRKIAKARNDQAKEVIIADYKNASLAHSLFNDMDKEVTYASVDNKRFITNFSLDTDWEKALEEVKNK